MAGLPAAFDAELGAAGKTFDTSDHTLRIAVRVVLTSDTEM